MTIPPPRGSTSGGSYGHRGAITIRTGWSSVRAQRWSSTVALCESHDLLACASAARRRLGELLGGSEGAAFIAEADRWYASEGVKNPERFTDMLAPGFRPRK